MWFWPTSRSRLKRIKLRCWIAVQYFTVGLAERETRARKSFHFRRDFSREDTIIHHHFYFFFFPWCKMLHNKILLTCFLLPVQHEDTAWKQGLNWEQEWKMSSQFLSRVTLAWLAPSHWNCHPNFQWRPGGAADLFQQKLWPTDGQEEAVHKLRAILWSNSCASSIDYQPQRWTIFFLFFTKYRWRRTFMLNFTQPDAEILTHPIYMDVQKIVLYLIRTL